MSDRVRRRVDGGRLELTLDRPDKRNAIDAAMVDSLLAGLDDGELSADVKVIIIRGAGKDFCAGADLAELLDSASRSPEENAASAAHLGEIFIRIRELPKPVVAVVQGRALAGGCGLATACDLVIARASAAFGYPEVRRGFVPAMVMAMLRRAVGEKIAFDLVATGRVLTAEEAQRMGLITRVLPDEGFEEAVGEIITRLSESSGTALSFIKRQLYDLEGTSFREAIRLGAEVNAMARSTPDFEAAVSAFLDPGPARS